ncbi:NETR-like protein, partial [Mya arenaria]
PYHGRVELKVNNTWGTVCGNGFDYSDANVICGMFGLRPLNISEARIINGTSPYIGRAEIKVNGTWGTICDNGFNSQDTSTACKMLGLKGADVYSNARYGQGSGPVFIDYLKCSYDTPTLNQCPYLAYNECSHQRDVSIACYGPTLNISEVRLVNGTGPDDGRAEILINEQWGTICDDNFDISDTEAFCRMLGKKGAQFFTAAYHGQGTGPVHIDRLDCQPFNQNLSDCPYLYTNTCSHARDVSVVCNGNPAKQIYRSAYFGPGFGPIFVDDLACDASATHINNCSYITEDNCNHNNDISVVCTGRFQ